MTPDAYLAAHGTVRWHTQPLIPPQTVADHAAGVARFVLWLDPESPLALVREALHHDDGEGVVGDMPGPAKRRFPQAAVLLAAAEHEARRDAEVPYDEGICVSHGALLRLADRLEAVSWVATMAPPHVLETQEWRDEIEHTRTLAWALDAGAGAKVEGWLADLGVHHAR